MVELFQLLHDWERAAAEILESHISYPVVCYFRSQHNNESWLGALVAILDACALLVSHREDACSRQARLTFAICRHTVVDLAQVFYTPPESKADRLPPAELERLRAALSQTPYKLNGSPEADAKMAKLRAMYEPYAEALAKRFAVDLPPWILSREITDNWRTTAWGRISSASASASAPASANARSAETVPDAHAD